MAKYQVARLCGVSTAIAAACVTVAIAQQPNPLPLGPARERGASVTPAYEGWYKNDDGSYSMLIGYYNRNAKEPLTIPIGPNNRIEPGEPDQGQPTYFEVGRQWGVFVIKVPKDFGNKVIKWTLTANGETQSIPFTLNPAYPITPFKELGMGNEPPSLAFSAGGPKVSGPPVSVSANFTGVVARPIAISVWVEDVKGKDRENSSSIATGRENSSSIATVSLHKYRGPGTVTFERARIPASKQGEMIAASATFSEPGEYLLRVQANDESGEGGGGFQCCWTNTYVKVTVKQEGSS